MEHSKTEIERIPQLIIFKENAPFKDVYGGSLETVALEAQLIRPKNQPSDTVLIFMHPISGLFYLPLPAALAAGGMHVLCCNTRYRGVDNALLMEKCLIDLGAAVRFAREKLTYQKIVLGGWSGGGSLSLFYQSQAEHCDITHTPAGDELNLQKENLLPADAVMLLAAHVSRAHTLTEWLDASVKNEQNPDEKIVELDLYNPQNPHQAPYSPGFLEIYREAQIYRNRKITAWVKEKLNDLKKNGRNHEEFAFVIHGTMADPRWLDPLVDPNDRKPGWCYLGDPRIVNNSPVGLARFSTLRSWLSQWSYDDSRADGVACARKITVPAMVVGNSADDACTPSHTYRLFEALAYPDKKIFEIKGANHYYFGQPEQLAEAAGICIRWIQELK